MHCRGILGTIVAFSVVSMNAYAGELSDCMSRHATKLADVQTQEVVRDQGCVTGPTVYVDNMTSYGFRTQSCQSDVCWKALPGRMITEAVVTSTSTGGSQHQFEGPTYVPDKTRAIGVCVHVEARGVEGEEAHSVGWQKVSMTVTTRHVVTEAEMIGIAEICIKSGKQGR